MEYRVLGPVSAYLEGQPRSLGGRRQRMVLAVLLANPNRVVSQDALIEAVWAGEAPEAAKTTLHSYVSHLRRELGGELTREGDGYRVTLGEGSLDALRFEHLVDQGRGQIESNPLGALTFLQQSLELWQGLPYGDLGGEPALAAEVARLGELRLAAVEYRIEADLAMGNHRRVIGELETLTREHPFRERLHWMHMLALYRSGRQADALRAFQRTRMLLAEELGIDPSSELRDLEQRILEQDPSLDLTDEPEVRNLTFLFTDLEDSTLMWELHPEAMSTALATHDRLLEDAIASQGGIVFKRTGDGIWASFTEVCEAVDAARVFQEKASSLDWGDIGPLRVRMAIDTGEVKQRDTDFFGTPLNRCARMTALAHGGQVLLSAEAHDRLQTAEPDCSVSLGEFKLRGLGRPQQLFQLLIDGLPRDFPPLRLDGHSHPRPVFDRTVRGYELRDQVGEGDYGVVYRAYQPSVGREVAIKVLRPEYVNRADFVRRFEAEAQVVARLEHPHIVTLFDFWRDPDGAYLVMPYMRGGNLAETLRRGPWNLGPALRLLEQVGSAVAHAHRQGVLHRDIKPGNVLLDEDGNAYLSDFGIATRMADDLGAPMTTSLAYVPPEEIRGEPLTPRSDIFSFAILAFQLLTGVHPSGRGPLPLLEEVRPGLPTELGEALHRAMDDQPANRFEKVEDFLRAVRQAVGVDVVAAADTEEAAPGAAPARNPYKGLRAFNETDSLDFHGREALIDDLLRAVGAHPLVAVVGPSGSGKSSVVRAGLIPALRAGGLPGSRGWLFTDMFPGSYPFEELEAALLRVAVDRPDNLLSDLSADERGLIRACKQLLPSDESRLVLIIDQFEEVFSSIASEDVRRSFLDSLTTVASDERSRIRLVLTMRADFFDRPLEYPDFADVFRGGIVTVSPPSDEGLAQAIA
ncbi:MAG TPA: BTAD domain-containing putative transcriptional regulator, partial [Acidimicrobiia bacterium]